MPVPITLDVAARAPKGALGALAVRAGSLGDDAPGLDVALAELAGFTGKPGQTLVTALRGKTRLLVGVGDEPTPAALRKAGAAAARAARTVEVLALDALGAVPAKQAAEAAGALAEGLALGSYGFADYKEPAEDTRLERVVLVAADGDAKRAGAIAAAVEAAVRRGHAVGLARDLVNTPGGDLTPTAFAEVAEDLAAEHGLEIEVWDRDRIVTELCGGLAGVARGSAQEPRLVRLTHRPAGKRKPRARLALVGKGVTFDAGGLSIKTATGMEGMKTDMAGAAAVLAAMTLVPSVAPRLEVTAYLPLTDNMLGGDATRVGDVLRIRNGTSVEVLNTDAEGRLILADALSLAAEAEPDAIVDLATLTGACMVALGVRTAGLMGNDEDLVERVLRAGERAGEALWALPLPDHLRATLDSEIADLRNIGTGPYGGALLAGTFLREFVGDVAWAHLDIAGPASTGTAYDEHPKGATGFGVRTLARLLADWA